MTGGGNSEAEETIPDRIEQRSEHERLLLRRTGRRADGAPAPAVRRVDPHAEAGSGGIVHVPRGNGERAPGDRNRLDRVHAIPAGASRRVTPRRSSSTSRGVGTFHNLKNARRRSATYVVVGESFHWFEVNIDDLGEPGRNGHQDPPAASSAIRSATAETAARSSPTASVRTSTASGSTRAPRTTRSSCTRPTATCRAGTSRFTR